jgi:hypothetical protein
MMAMLKGAGPMDMTGIYILDPPRRPFSEYAPDARAVCERADPPVTFREALSVYRQLRYGMLFFRNTYSEDDRQYGLTSYDRP